MGRAGVRPGLRRGGLKARGRPAGPSELATRRARARQRQADRDAAANRVHPSLAQHLIDPADYEA
jgi:hypothetical protein